MATIKQRRAFKGVLANMASDHPQTGKEILLDAGYSKTIAKNPQMVYTSKFFQEKLAKIDDTKIVDEFYSIALGDTDLRAKLQAGKEILMLKNRYPKETINLELRAKRDSFVEP